MYKDFIRFNQSVSSPDVPIEFQQLTYSASGSYEFLTSDISFSGFPYSLEIDFFYLDENRKIRKLTGTVLKRIDLADPIKFTHNFPGPAVGYRVKLNGGINPTVSGKILYTPVGVNND